MKKNFQLMLLMLCMTLILSVQVSAKSFVITDEKHSVASNKIWTIEFTHVVKFDEQTKVNITVKDSKGQSVPVTLKLGEDKKTVLVLPPEGGYKMGESYILSLNDNVRNDKDVKLKRNVYLNFIIENSAAIEQDGIFGNTIGNSINDSWVAEDANNVYFICGQYSNTFEGYIGKYNKNTKEVTRFTDKEVTDVSGINVVKDNIYYKVYEQDINGINPDNSYIYNLYKMSTSGGEGKKIVEGVWQYIASDKNIYYVSMVDNYKLCRCDINGQNKVVITEDPVEFFNVVGDKIVYTKRERKEIHNGFNSKFLGAIYKINLDGSNKIVLTEKEAHNIITVGNDVYYINYSDNNKIYKVSLDGSNDIKVSDNKAEYMNINDGWIYFANESASKTIYVGSESIPKQVGTLYKMKIDGTESTELNKEYFRGINVLNDAIYYNLYDDNGSMNWEIRMRIGKDGQNQQEYWKYLNGSSNINIDSVVKLESGIINIHYKNPGTEQSATVMDLDINKLPLDIKNKVKAFVLITTPYDYELDRLKSIASEIPDRTPLITHFEMLNFEEPGMTRHDYGTVMLFDEKNNMIAYYTARI
ncbi:DUF5050 domain-containing protein [Clostridium lundense]|uniref:DUF5050 domain-containing protein n=1 Tax=Clostridium lundense TaxID=319475 RepID=UPI000480815E|nr:DUF5050 domain-containing protein [Clostridium lundense]